jgi:hypothetical protein
MISSCNRLKSSTSSKGQRHRAINISLQNHLPSSIHDATGQRLRLHISVWLPKFRHYQNSQAVDKPIMGWMVREASAGACKPGNYLSHSGDELATTLAAGFVGRNN